METSVDERRPAQGRGQARRVPWSPRSWSQAIRLAGGIVIQLAPWLLLSLFGRAVLRGHDAHWPRWLLVYVLLSAVVLLLLVPALTRIQRHRLRASGVVIPPQPRRPGPVTPRGVASTLRSQPFWRQVGYHLLAGPLLAVAALVALGVWLTGVLYSTVYLYGWGLAGDNLVRRGTYPQGGAADAARVGAIPAGVLFTALGIVLLCVAPVLTAAVAAVDARAARSLLGPSRAEQLAHRVEHLTQTRAGVVDAADAERRRLERDLHDGTQQRLVSLAINLGMARNQAGNAEQANQAIAEAHEEAKAALAELRDLIRGLHPAVLEDRGLDAALSGVVARMAIPVRLTVDDMQRRASPVIEAVAYFVVSEGLANIAKHAQASQAEVIVQRAGDRLHVIVSDDGVGGANPARGTGLDGLRKRAESVDGMFDISSPPGGPTLLTVDLPCVR
jgi:signal transduction histidine kinase